MSNKLECRAGPTPATRIGHRECQHCTQIALELFHEVKRRHSDKEAVRIFSKIAADDPELSEIFGIITQRDLIHANNADLLEDFDAAMKINPNVTAFVKDRAAQNKEIFKTYDAARKSGQDKSVAAMLCFDKHGRHPPRSRRGAGSTNSEVLRRHLDKLRKEQRALRDGHSFE